MKLCFPWPQNKGGNVVGAIWLKRGKLLFRWEKVWTGPGQSKHSWPAHSDCARPERGIPGHRSIWTRSWAERERGFYVAGNRQCMP